jgi:hypothetical protein
LFELKFATDAYYNFAVNAMVGSAVIEKPLAVYRIHGANYFSSRATMHLTLAFNKDEDDGPRAAFFALEYMTSEYDKFLAMSAHVDVMFSAMRILKKRANHYNKFAEKCISVLTKFYFTYVVGGMRRRFAGPSTLERLVRDRNRE